MCLSEYPVNANTDTVTSANETYFFFLVTPRCLLGMKYIRMRASSTRFLKKVCQWVRWIASPKHPQSICGLKITRSRVRKVKNPCMTRAIMAVVLRHTPVIRATPTRVSANANATPIIFDENARKPRCRKS